METQTEIISRSNGKDHNGESLIFGVSIRAWIVAGETLFVCLMGAFRITVEEPLYSGYMLSLGYYFGNKNPNVMNKAAIVVGSLLLVGCSHFNTHQLQVITEENGASKRIETSTKGFTFFDSTSKLSDVALSNTDRSQSAKIGGISQTASGTNAVEFIQAIVEAAVTGGIKGVKP